MEPEALDALPLGMARQAVALWSHLPEGEITSHQELWLRTDGSGNLLVHVLATGRNYRFKDGVAWRARKLPTGELEVTSWQGGQRCTLRLLASEGEVATWNCETASSAGVDPCADPGAGPSMSASQRPMRRPTNRPA